MDKKVCNFENGQTNCFCSNFQTGNGYTIIIAVNYEAFWVIFTNF